MEDKTKILQRIEALLAKAESTNFEEEAKVYMEKAQDLLAKYSLSEFDLTNAKKLGVNDTIATVCVLISEPNPSAKRVLLGKVAAANGLRVVMGPTKSRRESGDKIPVDYRTGQPMRIVSTDKKHRHYQRIWVTGFTRDIDAALLLYSSMLIQIAGNVKKAEIPEYVNKHTWINHYILGFATEVGRRLQQSATKAEREFVETAKEQGNDLLPVIVERRTQIKEAYEAMWKGSTKTSSANYSRTTTSGYGAGRSAGSTADIGNKRIGGVAALGR